MPAPVPTPFSYAEDESQSHSTQGQEGSHEEDQIIDWGDEDSVPDWDLAAQFTDSDYYSDYYDDEYSEWESDWDSDEDNSPPPQHPAIAHTQRKIDSLRSELEKLESEQELALRCTFNGPPYRDVSDEALMEWADLDQWLDEYEAKKEKVLSQVIEAEQELIMLVMKVEGLEGEVDMLDPRRVTAKVKYGGEEEEPAGSQEEDLQRRFENVKRFAQGIWSWGDENHRPSAPERDTTQASQPAEEPVITLRQEFVEE